LTDALSQWESGKAGASGAGPGQASGAGAKAAAAAAAAAAEEEEEENKATAPDELARKGVGGGSRVELGSCGGEATIASPAKSFLALLEEGMSD